VATIKRTLSLGAAIDKGKLDSGVAYLFFVQIQIYDRFTDTYPVTLRFLRNVGDGSGEGNDDVTWQGVTWTPAAFDISLKEAAGEVPRVSLTANDVIGTLRAQMELYDGAVGSKVQMQLTRSDMLTVPTIDQVPEILENFVVLSGSVANRSVSMELGARALLSDRFPRRIQSRDMCQWTYKGTECQYSGGILACDRTLQGVNGCAVHENSLNFGGFPGIRNRNV